MALAPDPTTPTHGLTYGRRKRIPILLGAVLLAVSLAVTARFALTRVYECMLVVWFVWCAYRYWSVPMTPRYAAAVERRRRWRALEMSPKVVLGVIGAVVGFYGVFFVVLLVAK